MDTLDRLIEQARPLARDSQTPGICIGVHWTLVTLRRAGNLCGGLSSTLSGGHGVHHHGGGPPVRQAGHLQDLSPLELITLVHSASTLEVSVGMATLNALIEVDESACRDVNAAAVLAEHGAGRHIAMVGHFPFTQELREKAARLSVLELEPGEGDLPAAEAPRILPEADVVGLTGTSLLNGTFDTLIRLCRPDAFVIMLGATTPLSPLFFEVGVSAVAGTRVIDTQAAQLAVSQGATFRQIPGKRLLTLFRP